MEELYSRQLQVIGKHNMKKILNLNILLIGVDSIGQECAKSLSLMGVGNIYIFDDTRYDKNKHYSRVISNKKNSSRDNLSNISKKLISVLNPNVNVIIINTSEHLYSLLQKKTLDCVVQSNINSYLKIETSCISNNIPYILGINNGLLGYIFVNFHKWQYECVNENKFQEYLKSYSISHNTIHLTIESSNNNHLNQLKLTHKSNKLIVNIIDTSYQNNEIIINIKKTDEIVRFLKYPNVIIEELTQKQFVNHISHKDIIKKKQYKYINSTTSFSNNDEVYDEYIGFIKGKNRLKNSDILFHPLCCIIGGILASEVIKLTGKNKPLSQELLFDYSIFNNNNKYGAKNKKFQDVYELFDKDLIKIIKKQKILMTGCGALGCEISKNLGMLGFCSSKKGLLQITDMDTIELSNLSRQFLFNSNDINKLKSETIKNKLAFYSPHMHIKDYSLKVCDNNENTFNASFWKDNDIFINALDNVEARKYIDRKAVLYKRPLFESGTLGNKANTQVIIPDETATYSEIKDIPSKNIPMCTIRNFPNNINHCIEWSLNVFEKIFTQTFIDYKNFSDNKLEFLDTIQQIDNTVILYERLYNLNILCKCIQNYTEETLINFGLDIYKYYFYTPLVELLQTFPENMKTESGSLFWSGNKIRPALFNTMILNKEYFNYLLKMLNVSFNKQLTITNYNYDKIETLFHNKIKNKLNGRKITVNRKNNKIAISIDKLNIKNVLEKLNMFTNTLEEIKIEPGNYNKDIEEHLNIIAYFTNLRAKIYSINEEETINIKIISGRIMPALATTTSIISGFVIIDILKHLIKKLNYRKVKYTEININISNNIYNIFSAAHPKNTYNNMFHDEYGTNILTVPEHFSTWSSLNINRKLDKITTITSLLYHINKKFKIQPDVLIYKSTIIYNKSNRNPIYNDLEDVYNNLNIDINDILVLNIINFNDSGVPILSPPIYYSLTK